MLLVNGKWYGLCHVHTDKILLKPSDNIFTTANAIDGVLRARHTMHNISTIFRTASTTLRITELPGVIDQFIQGMFKRHLTGTQTLKKMT